MNTEEHLTFQATSSVAMLYIDIWHHDTIQYEWEKNLKNAKYVVL